MTPKPTHSFLGDSTVLVLPLSWKGVPFDPTGSTCIWTLKSSADLPDVQATAQKITGTGLQASGTYAVVTLVAADTATAAPGIYVWDVQAQNLTTGEVRTVASGRHELRRDVTRGTSTEVPIYTTEPGAPGVIPVILRTTAEGPPDETVVAAAIGQFARVGDASTYDWYRWDGTVWEPLESGGGTVTSVGIIATSDINVVGSPITTAGTIALSLNYGNLAGTVCAGNDPRLSNSRTPTAHSHGSISNTGTIGDTEGLPLITTTGGLVTTGSFGTAPGTFAAGNHSHTPAELGAVATSALSTTATANSVVQRDSSGNLFGNVVSGAAGVFANSSAYGAIAMTVVGDPEDDGIPTLGVGNSVLRADGYLQVLGLEDLDSSAPTGGLVKSHSLELVIIFDPVEEVEENPSITLHTVGGGSVVIGPDSADTSNRTLTTPKASGIFAITSRADGQIAPNAIVTEADSFTLSQATHWRKWIRLTKTSGTTTITLPTSGIDPGCPFEGFRAGAGAIAFSGGTVNGSERLADVPVNGAFGLVYLGSGTYDFV